MGVDLEPDAPTPGRGLYHQSTNYRQTLQLYVGLHFTVVSEYAIVIHV